MPTKEIGIGQEVVLIGLIGPYFLSEIHVLPFFNPLYDPLPNESVKEFRFKRLHVTEIYDTVITLEDERGIKFNNLEDGTPAVWATNVKSMHFKLQDHNLFSDQEYGCFDLAPVVDLFIKACKLQIRIETDEQRQRSLQTLLDRAVSVLKHTYPNYLLED